MDKAKAQGLRLGGRGRLTDDRVKKVTNYFCRAIKDNAGKLDAMEQAVWATFFHSLGTYGSSPPSLPQWLQLDVFLQ